MEQEYSKDVIDVLGKAPNRLIRYGLSVFFLIQIGIIVGACFVRFPDSFEVPITISNENGIYTVSAQINSSDIWRIKTDARVIINLNQFPKNAYGVLVGNIEKISYNNESQLYDVCIRLENGLITSFDRNLEYSLNMSGTGIVEGEDKSVIKRVFSSAIVEK
jgi:hypothetical protein